MVCLITPDDDVIGHPRLARSYMEENPPFRTIVYDKSGSPAKLRVTKKHDLCGRATYFAGSLGQRYAQVSNAAGRLVIV